MLAVLLVTVIFGFADMHLQSQKALQMQTSGNWHYQFSDLDEKSAELIAARTEVVTSYWDTVSGEKRYVVQLSPFCNMQNTVDDIMVQLQLSEKQITANVSLLGLIGQIRGGYASQVYMIAIVLFFVIVLTGVLMISSTLNSNVTQRTEFFGMMRCLGASKKQVKRFVRLEALRWCITGIPIGLISGIVIVWILSAIIKTISPTRFALLPVFGISWVSIFVGVILGLFAVLLAARAPAKKAAGVSPLEAASGNADTGIPFRKAAKTRFYKIETALGIHHAKARKKSYILMTASFAISIVLFLGFSTIVDFMNHAMKPLKPWTPDLSIVSESNSCSINRGLVDEISQNKAVNHAYGRMFSYDIPVVIGNEAKRTNLISYEDQQFSWATDTLLDGNLESVMQEENQVLFVYNESLPINIGDSVKLSINNEDKTVTVAGILSDSPLARESNTETIICSEKTFTSLTEQSGYTIIDVQFKSSATEKDIAVIEALTGSGVAFVDNRSDNQEARSFYNAFRFFVYSFLFVIAAITIFNIINTISMSVAAKIKHYGIMRAIGMSERQMVKMIRSEAMVYAISGSVIGCVLGLPLHMVIYLSMITTVWGVPWAIPYAALGIIIAIVLLTTFLSVLGPSKKIKSMSIVNMVNTQ